MPKKTEETQDLGYDSLALSTRPKKVALVALGRSAPAFAQAQMRTEMYKSPFDEVWAINRGFKGYIHDKLFLMDDLKWLRQVKDKYYADALKKHDKPIVTSTAYSEWPTSVDYPLEDVLGHYGGEDIFTHNGVSYAVAYADFIGVEDLWIFGADFIYPHGNMAEEGGMAVAYLLGLTRGSGRMNFHLPPETTMLYAHQVQQTPAGPVRPRYGYHRIEEMAKATKDARDKKKARQRNAP
jgi:hypothetical protein